MPRGSIVVTAIAGKFAAVTVEGSEDVLSSLFALGFAFKGEELVRIIHNDDDRLALIRSLIALKALFMGGPDWSPCELVAYYHEQKKLSEAYSEIVWKSPEAYLIRNHEG